MSVWSRLQLRLECRRGCVSCQCRVDALHPQPAAGTILLWHKAHTLPWRNIPSLTPRPWPLPRARRRRCRRHRRRRRPRPFWRGGCWRRLRTICHTSGSSGARACAAEEGVWVGRPADAWLAAAAVSVRTRVWHAKRPAAAHGRAAPPRRAARTRVAGGCHGRGLLWTVVDAPHQRHARDGVAQVGAHARGHRQRAAGRRKAAGGVGLEAARARVRGCARAWVGLPRGVRGRGRLAAPYMRGGSGRAQRRS